MTETLTLIETALALPDSRLPLLPGDVPRVHPSSLSGPYRRPEQCESERWMTRAEWTRVRQFEESGAEADEVWAVLASGELERWVGK